MFYPANRRLYGRLFVILLQMARKEKMFKGDAPRRMQEVVDERERAGAEIKNYGGTGGRIIMEWNLNPNAIADQMFKLRIGDNTAYIDAEEIRRYLRWV